MEQVFTVIDPGRTYQLADGNLITFLKREDGQTILEGTTNEELISVLIDRLRYQNQHIPSRETSIAITKLEDALLWLQYRTALRIAQGVESTNAPHQS